MIVVVVGARPNFVKVAPVWHALEEEKCLIHTGQHYSPSMSHGFFRELDLPPARYQLGIGSGPNTFQVAKVIHGIAPLLKSLDPEAVLVAGDVNSTLGAGLAAAQLGYPVIHLESGLRSYDWTMPEELNRCLVDRLSSLCLTTTHGAVRNLVAEGKPRDDIKFVGNTMIDSLWKLLPEDCDAVARRYDLVPGNFILATLHRPALADSYDLVDVLEVLREHRLPVLLPAHPRLTGEGRGGLDVWKYADEDLRIWPPLPYSDFLALEQAARLVVTDSGGVQEETTALGTPCYTIRPNTERPITCSQGTNHLVKSAASLKQILRRRIPEHGHVEVDLWDGHAGPRAAGAITGWLRDRRNPPQAHASGDLGGQPVQTTAQPPASA